MTGNILKLEVKVGWAQVVYLKNIFKNFNLSMWRKVEFEIKAYILIIYTILYFLYQIKSHKLQKLTEIF